MLMFLLSWACQSWIGSSVLVEAAGNDKHISELRALNYQNDKLLYFSDYPTL